MSLPEMFGVYLLVLKTLVMIVAVTVLISSLDDLFIDIVYWARRLWRWLTVYRRHPRMRADALLDGDEQPLAIMVPAWQESEVIGHMAELLATTLDYENYQVFVGTYPNDEATGAEVDRVSAHYPNVHKIVCTRPGPTSKADCLNNVLDAIFQFEARSGVQFAGFILHDAEDVLAKLELRLFNYLVGRKDLIQLPVYPLERPLWDFTGGHYLDEFAELHGKDIVVREALVGQVPSAGVGTCFSRRAILALLAQGDGQAFDTHSLTEDYDIGFRLKQLGMKEIFVRFPTFDERQHPELPVRKRAGRSNREASVISVREYFPNRVAAAARQKSRWITGIVIQGYRTLGWTDDVCMNYFLWRDRKGMLTNLVSFTATLLAIQFLMLWAYQVWIPGEHKPVALFAEDRGLVLLLLANLALMVNRLVQRFVFVTSYYGFLQGVVSIPRLVWGNWINFVASCKAIAQVVRARSIRRLAWAKTDHDFPELSATRGHRRPLGAILVEQGALTDAQLRTALQIPIPGLRLGARLVHGGYISGRQLAAAVAVQGGLSWESIPETGLDPRLVNQLPAALALRYAVVPLREDAGTLVLGSESIIDPVSLAALRRKLKRKLRCVILPKGEATVALRRWYARQATEPAHELLAEAVAQGRLGEADATCLWREYTSRQLLLGDMLLATGRIDRAALSAVLLRHEKVSSSLGEFLVDQGILCASSLHEALVLQGKLQISMVELLAGHEPQQHAATALI